MDCRFKRRWVLSPRSLPAWKQSGNQSRRQQSQQTPPRMPQQLRMSRERSLMAAQAARTVTAATLQKMNCEIPVVCCVCMCNGLHTSKHTHCTRRPLVRVQQSVQKILQMTALCFQMNVQTVTSSPACPPASPLPWPHGYYDGRAPPGFIVTGR